MVSNLILYDKYWADYIYITVHTFIQSSLSDPALSYQRPMVCILCGSLSFNVLY